MTRRHTPLRVAYQGERGAFSELAIFRLCGEDAHPVPCTSFGDVTHVVEAGDADCGLLPVHNTVAGPVHASMEAIGTSGLHVVMASEMPIKLCLLALPGATIETLRSAESHPVALRQCGRFLAEHPQLRTREAYDTAGGARLVSESGDLTRAAIASARAGSVHGLVTLCEGIEDRSDTVTRFVVVSREPAHSLSELLDRDRRSINLG
jgi:prephenate dehydratase